MTEPREKDGSTKYYVTQRVSICHLCRSWELNWCQPIPLDLLTLSSFSDPPRRVVGLFRGLRGGGGGGTNATHADSPGFGAGGASSASGQEIAGDSRLVYPFRVHHNARAGMFLLYTESNALRLEWKSKLEEAIGLRKVLQESNKVFETEVLSQETFFVPSMRTGPATPEWNGTGDTLLTGKATCSIPFSTFFP
jgi:RHO1 GDP-GTP exchange protein 1/2